MNWIPLTDIAQLDAIDSASSGKRVLIFKHSTTCSISRAALDRMERAWTVDDAAQRSAYYLDLLRFRSVSNAVADRYGIEHESPQVLVIDKGVCAYTRSHFAITYKEVVEELDGVKEK